MAKRSARVTWEQVPGGNAHVADGCMGFWAEFPRGSTARQVLEEYMATADYTSATEEFEVTAEINGEICSCKVGPGGERI